MLKGKKLGFIEHECPAEDKHEGEAKTSMRITKILMVLHIVTNAQNQFLIFISLDITFCCS